MQTPSEKALRTARNKFRGLISDFKSRGFIERSAPPSKHFRSGLRELYLDARSDLHPSQFDQFLDWIKHHTNTQLPDLSRMPIGYEELTGVFVQAPTVTLERELIWMAARIRSEAQKLTAIRAAIEAVEHLVFQEFYEEAITCLQTLEKVAGSSLWMVQLRLALEHLAGGLERQKRYTAEVRSVYKTGLLGFVTYHTSVLNEDRTTLAKFREDIKIRIEKQRHYQPFLKTYVQFRLTGEWPYSEQSIADVLRVEQSHSLLDVYETFIGVIQELVRREDLIELRGVARKCLQGLRSVDDYRLRKAELVLGETCDRKKIKLRSTEISDALCSAKVRRAIRATDSLLTTTSGTDPWQQIYAGFSYAHIKGERSDQVSESLTIPRLIGRILGRHDSNDDSFPLLGKLITNLRGLPTASGLIEMITQLRRITPDSDWRPWLVGLNSSTLGIEDFPPNSDDSLIGYAALEPMTSCSTYTTWKSFYIQDGEPSEAMPYVVAVIASAGLLRRREYSGAAGLLIAQQAKKSGGPLKALANSLLVHAYYGLADRQKVIELLADDGARSVLNRQLAPVRAALQHYVWEDYKAVESALTVPIALHMLWTENEDDMTLSLLRFATAKFLRSTAAQRPSKLFDRISEFPKHQLTYFLKKICVQQNLDVSRVLKSSREVMEERQAVCAVLRLLDPVHAEDYQAEVMSISNQLAMDDGQLIVDRTRIHVETEALLRWAMRELSEDYDRYRDLLPVDVGRGQSFEDVLKELEVSGAAQKTSFMPQTEADAVLLSILRRLGDEFLENASFGLDFYLSQRIRHQSFVGLIRGPLESSSLITTRVSEAGEYHKNVFWLKKFTSISQEDEDLISAALSKFALNFDETLAAAKDRSFQIRSSDKPSGLLFLDLSTQLLAFARAVVRLDAERIDFFETSVAILWAALEQSLAAVRTFIADDLKTKITEGFDELKAVVRAIAESDEAFLEFDMEVGQRSTEVQRAFDDAARWFTRTDVEAHKKLFTLPQVLKIAIDSALKSQRAFDPEILSEVSGELSMNAGSLVFVHDVLFVALDNIRAHSELKRPKVRVRAVLDIEESTLTIVVRSECKAQNFAAKEKSLREIKQLIDGGTVGRRTRREGGSGFAKLAAVVAQSEKGRIDFGFVEVADSEEKEFKLSVTYSLVMKQEAQIEGDL